MMMMMISAIVGGGGQSTYTSSSASVNFNDFHDKLIGTSTTNAFEVGLFQKGLVCQDFTTDYKFKSNDIYSSRKINPFPVVRKHTSKKKRLPAIQDSQDCPRCQMLPVQMICFRKPPRSHIAKF
eukprot:m.114498 g.114498  ORF g.114498 m.114498 type:complete len:124 (-) comp9279_c2_seq19:4930-5301(-)